jgi:NADPH2:quinone reductase
VGGQLSEPAFRSLGWNGRHLVIGFASGSIPALPANLPLLKGAALVGVFWGAFVARQPQDNLANFQQLFRWHAEGRLKPLISQTYPLEHASEAIARLAARQALGKLVVQVR